MNESKKSLLAIVLSMLVLLAWVKWFSPPIPPPPQLSQDGVKGGEVEGSEGEKGLKKEPLSPLVKADFGRPEEKVFVETSKISSIFSNVGGTPVTWNLLAYPHEINGSEAPVDLIGETASFFSLSFLEANFDWPETPRYQGEKMDPHTLLYRWRSENVEATQKITLDPESYNVEVLFTLKNLGDVPLQAKPRWELRRDVDKESEKKGMFSFIKGPPNHWHPVYWFDGKVRRHENIGKPIEEAQSGKVYWAGVEDRYFLSAMIPQTPEDREVRWGVEESGNKKKIYAQVSASPISLPPGATWQYPMKLYLGVKEIGMLQKGGARLDEAIDYGFFGIVAIPLLHLLKFFYQVVHNYGLAIILLTILIKLLLHPINKRSMGSMKAMQNLQPKLKELREKYKNDKQRLNMETMNLFKLHKVNPMGGCLPMLAQFPIYIALYKVLWNSVELYRAPFFWFYKDLSAPDPYLISPILLGIAMFAQQKLMPAATMDPAQRKMMMFMPLMFCVFMLFLPSG